MQVTIFRSSAEQSYQFLCYLDKNEVSKPIYNDYQHQESKITIYNNLTGLVLARAARERTFLPTQPTRKKRIGSPARPRST